MSHRDDCPSRYRAEREGEDAFRWRDRENPYEDRYGREGCPEAARAWSDGYRYAERRDEEQRAEEAASERRAHARAEQARYEQEQEEAYYFQQPPPEQEPNYCAESGHPYHGDDSHGPRCMCGERRDFPTPTPGSGDAGKGGG